jgi:hypothetical protein
MAMTIRGAMTPARIAGRAMLSRPRQPAHTKCFRSSSWILYGRNPVIIHAMAARPKFLRRTARGEPHATNQRGARPRRRRNRSPGSTHWTPPTRTGTTPPTSAPLPTPSKASPGPSTTSLRPWPPHACMSGTGLRSAWPWVSHVRPLANGSAEARTCPIVADRGYGRGWLAIASARLILAST